MTMLNSGRSSTDMVWEALPGESRRRGFNWITPTGKNYATHVKAGEVAVDRASPREFG